MLNHLRVETDKKFPGKGTTFAGSYVFLRYICPAVVFPEQNGILPGLNSNDVLLVLINRNDSN